MEFFYNWLMMATIMLFFAMAPGPDFVMTIRNSLMYSRRAGIFTALGFSLGICVHTAYCVIGIAAVISQSIMLFNILKWAGAAYLIYMGFHAIRSKGFKDAAHAQEKSGRDISVSQAIQTGFITNLLNPKATMFFFALFTQIIDPHTPVSVQILYGATAATITGLWFAFVAIVLTTKLVKNRFLGFSKTIGRVCGGLMIAFGLKLALTKAAT